MSDELQPVSIQQAEPDVHIKHILDMIKELSEFEKMPAGRVTISESALAADMRAGHIHAFVAELEEKIVGFVSYYYAYSSREGRFIFMEDLFVRSGYRGRGIGKRLWARLAKLAVSENLPRLQWSVLDWNTNAIAFYKKFGAIDLHETEGRVDCRLTREYIEKVATNT